MGRGAGQQKKVIYLKVIIMETKVNYTIVGAFVILLVAVICLALVWLSSGLSFEQYSKYLIFMQESVSGLNVDSQVEYNGVDVGSVSSIGLSQKNPQLVEVLINIKSSTPITRGTTATLTGRGLTGMVYISLKDKSTDLKPLVREHGQPYPVIKTAPSIYTRLETALTQFSDSFRIIANSLQGLLDKENLSAFKASLANLQVITKNLATSSHRFDGMFKNIEKASSNITPFMQSGTKTMNQIQAQTLPAATQMFSNINDAADNLSAISTELKQDPSILIRGVSRPPPGPGE
jgi:phospholipid/cholesterol/gamma-HCH transport system substrate-binding protein